MPRPKRARPFPRVGAFVKSVRVSRGLKAKDVAEKAAVENSLVSRLEKGENVYLEQYDKVARAMGFRGILEMFKFEPDPPTRRLLRYWADLRDDERARNEVLDLVKARADALSE